MSWVKRGLIFAVSGDLPWAATHAMSPCVERVGSSIWRVYFCARDAQGRGQIGSFEFDPETPGQILNVSQAPVLGIGPPGGFDDSGVVASCVVPVTGGTRLYYNGWSLGVTVPFYINIGLAVRHDGSELFHSPSRAPLLDRSAVDPYLTASACVRIEQGMWRMWYTSGTEWRRRADGLQHRYHIKYAESKDGVTWNRAGVVCIDYKNDEEYAIARPWVVKDADRYRMWYCHRGPSYRIGYAESEDGIRWNRMDHAAGIDVSPSGWDSEMLAYPCVFDHEGGRYMLYNGDGYGRTGIGLAVQVAP
jgi:predicted GH43/DUF377 family glycosyl hydrolase